MHQKSIHPPQHNLKYSNQNNYGFSSLPTKNDKNQQNNLIANVGMMYGKSNSWLMGTQISAATMGKSLDILKKLKINLLYNPAMLVIGIYP